MISHFNNKTFKIKIFKLKSKIYFKINSIKRLKNNIFKIIKEKDQEIAFNNLLVIMIPKIYRFQKYQK